MQTEQMQAQKKRPSGRKKQQALLVGCLVLMVALIWGLHAAMVSGDGRVFPVYLTEVLASNTGYPNEDGLCCDYLELYNSADYPEDLTGFQLGDVAGESRYAFPRGTILEPHAYLAVYCDKTVADPAYADFGISRSGGEDFYLIASNHAVVDQVTTLPMDSDQAMALQKDGTWALTELLTPGRPNDESQAAGRDLYNESVSPIRISEFSSVNSWYEPESGLLCDWVELYNPSASAADLSGYTLSDNVGNDKYRLPDGTVLEAGAYLVIPCADGAGPAAAPFGLSQQGGELVFLKDAAGSIVELVDSRPMEQGSLQLQADGQWTVTDQPSPGFSNDDRGHQAFLEAVGAVPGTIAITEVPRKELRVRVSPPEDREKPVCS